MSYANVLIVEDDLDGQEVIHDMLDTWGIDSDYVGDAETALNVLTSHSYDAMIIDLALPGMDGMALLSRIRNNARTANMPCIAVTAFDNNKVKHEAFEAGFNAYVAKPISDLVLQESLDQLLG